MKETHPSDHLQLLDHLALISKAQLAFQRTATNVAALPATAQAVHYGPDGQRVAGIAALNFAGIKTDSAGNILGGSLQQQMADESGKPLDASVINFLASGKPGLVHTTINNRFDDGEFKKVSTDLSGVDWTEDSVIRSGQVRIRSTQQDNLRSEGTLSFLGEKVNSGSFTHYSPHGEGTVTGYTQLDYSTLKTVGTRIVGGYIGVQSHNAARQLKSNSNMFMAPSGTLLQVHTLNMDPDTQAVKSSVVADFSNVGFNARNHIESGTADYRVTGNNQNLLSQTQVTYKDRAPQYSATEIYDDKNKLKSRVSTDYSGARFNNDMKPVNSTITTTAQGPDGGIQSVTQVTYDENGYQQSRQVTNYSSKTGKPVSVATSDLSNVMFDHQYKPLSGEINTTTEDISLDKIIRTVKSIGGNDSAAELSTGTNSGAHTRNMYSEVADRYGAVSKTQSSVNRPDGTLFKQVVTSFDDGVPVNVQVSFYDTDGSTLVKVHKIDLGQVRVVDGGTPRGDIGIDTYFRGTTLDTSSKLSY